MIKKGIDKIAFLINAIFVLLLLLSFIVPKFSVVQFPFLAIISLGVPLLIVVNLFFSVFWLWKRRHYFLYSTLVLALSFWVYGSFIQWKPSVNYAATNTLKFTSFNTRLFNKYQWSKKIEIGEDIVEFAENTQSDLLCFQEFDIDYKDRFKEYPYRVFSTLNNSEKAIQATFSKHPIVASKIIDFPSSTNAALYTDIKINSDTIRVYNIHLQSLRVNPDPEEIKKEEPGHLYKRLSISFSKQQEQADILRRHLDESPYRNVLMGDFNNTQFSRIYQLIIGDMKDSYLEQGSGFGKTFDYAYFPMRIDFILADESLPFISHENYTKKMSDHFPVTAQVNLNP